MITITEVILIRHGETQWNEHHRYQGHSNIDLSSVGREQAHSLKRRFRHEKFDAIYASDLNRARETAEILAEPHNLIVKTFKDLREINFGDWEGLTHQEIIFGHREIADKWYTAPANTTIPGGESFAAMKERSYSAVLKLVKSHPDERIAIVTHGGTVRAIICAILDLHLDKVWHLRQDNTAVNIIQFFENRAMLVLFNDTHHLLEKKLT